MNDYAKLDTQGLYDYSFERYEYYRAKNPLIAGLIDETSGRLKLQRGQLAALMFPIFYALNKFAETFPPIPEITKNTAAKCREEMTKIGAEAFTEKEFRHWCVATPEVIKVFSFFLEILVNPEKEEHLYREGRRLFALILHMIWRQRTG